MRLAGKTAIVIGAGQSPGEGMGNGRATCIRFAQEGASIMAVDKDLASAEETIGLLPSQKDSFAFQADVTQSVSLKNAVEAALARWGRIDILHYNVGVSLGGGDARLESLTEEAFEDRKSTRLNSSHIQKSRMPSSA